MSYNNSYGFKLLYHITNIMDMNQRNINIVMNAEKMCWVCYVINILLKIVVHEQSILIEQSNKLYFLPFYHWSISNICLKQCLKMKQMLRSGYI